MNKVQTYILAFSLFATIVVLGHNFTSKADAQSDKHSLFLENISASSNSPDLKFYPDESTMATLPINRTSNMLIFKDAGLGLKFEIPIRWGDPMKLLYQCDIGCTELSFSLWGKDDAGKSHLIGITVLVYDKESFGLQGRCHCNSLKDFMARNYKPEPSVTFINDNQTSIGRNYSSWQTESVYVDDKMGTNSTWISVFTINDNRAYEFRYGSEKFEGFTAFPDFKTVLQSVRFIPAEESKKPSFLMSNTPNSSSSSPTVGNKFAQDMTVRISSSNDFIDTIGYLHVVGEVKNGSPILAKFVKVIGTFYDSSDNVVGTGFTYTQPSDIPIGQSGPFELFLTSASIPISQIDHYKLAVTYQ
jgi:hypothetical protein